MISTFAILPFILILIIYVGILALTIWFAVSLIKAQKERNIILKEISNKLDNSKINNKEE
ncbi:hypothetical protein HPT25_07295 [Bacillus sp. BRMEA1]|uniref:hypothetical protein n=1 Tax=Neobacillus endophyticus TaxID=2738405 RepID=UPI001564D693|nr:hypothetical protein [Neobacillus endophyticus]NRD77302.1 hypothetical protein [Neobacillus endophyticus]